MWHGRGGGGSGFHPHRCSFFVVDSGVGRMFSAVFQRLLSSFASSEACGGLVGFFAGLDPVLLQLDEDELVGGCARDPAGASLLFLF
jgi:hypothetical protein